MMNGTTATTKSRDPEEILLALYTRFAASLPRTLWAWEQERWHELVFALLAASAGLQVHPDTVRRLTGVLADLHVLDVNELAECHPDETGTSTEPSLVTTLRYHLEKVGFFADQARSATAAICQAAAALQQNYEGKIQLYLRQQGQRLVDDLAGALGLSDFAPATKALALWSQNTLNLPVPVSDAFTAAACNDLETTYERLVEAADRLNINVALLDDALRAYWEERVSDGESPGGSGAGGTEEEDTWTGTCKNSAD